MTSDGGRGRGERRYRLLLRVYPERVRDESGPELLERFRQLRDRALDETGRLGVGFWWFIVRDTAAASWRERSMPLDASGRPPVGAARGGDGPRGYADDLGYAARRLLRSPGFALTALAILVLGIGVNATAFTVVNALLLQAPPFEAPERVVDVLQDSDAGLPSSTSYPAYLDMTRVEGVFESLSAFYGDRAFLEQGESLTPILVEYATASYLDVVGLAPARGVWFAMEQDDPSGPPVAVVTHGMWLDRLGADPDILGRTLRINGASVTVVGVGPPEFNGGRGPAAVDLWLSISAMAPTGGRAFSLDRRQDHPFTVRARLAPGVSVEQASAAMARLAGDLARTYPELEGGREITVLSVLDNRISPEVDSGLVPAATLVMAVVVLVLLVGTFNLANLLLVRSTARAREIAVRLALGASRARVVRVVMAEAVVLAALGALGGLGMAVAVAAVLRNSRFDLGLPIVLDLQADVAVVLFTGGVAVLAALVFGLLPALRATGRDVNATLRDAATASIGARRRFGLAGALVAGQVAVSLVLLVVSGVFVESLLRARGADPGFAWEDKAIVRLNAGPLGLDADGGLALFALVRERLEGLPGIGRATASVMLPAEQFGTTTLLLGSAIEGADRPTEIPWNFVTPEYFEVMGIPLLHGRLLSASGPDGEDETVVSASFARTYWGRTDVVGEVYRSEADPNVGREIVGVVGDAVVRTLGEGPTPALYWPLDFAAARINFTFEFEGAPSQALRAAQQAVREIDDRILILGATTMRDHLGQTLAQDRLAGGVFAALALAALLLATLGIYGVVAFAVSQRRHEVGIRIALGAAKRSVVRLFVRDVSSVVLIGAVVGLALAVPLGLTIGRLFTGAAPSPWTVALVATVLMSAALAATLMPALRATRADPTSALRRE